MDFVFYPKPGDFRLFSFGGGIMPLGGMEDQYSGGIAQKKAAATIVQRPFTSVCYEKFERMKLHSFGVVLIILF